MVNEAAALKANSRITLNTRLLAIAIGIFFVINLRPELLTMRTLVIQLVLSIPFLLTSTLSYSKMSYKKQIENWNTLSWVTFNVGYSFIVNAIGILLGRFNVGISLLFFVTSWVLTFIYSYIYLRYEKDKLTERIIKDGLCILIQLFLGLFVVLGYY